MIRLENVLKISLQDVLKTYSQDEYIGLDQDVLKTSSEDVRLRRTYSSWSRRLEDVFWRRRRKTSSSRRMFEGQEHFNLIIRLENVLKTSWRRMAKTNILVLTKTSWRRLEDVFWRQRRKTSSRRLQDVFIKTNVCLEGFKCFLA